MNLVKLNFFIFEPRSFSELKEKIYQVNEGKRAQWGEKSFK